jgi:hypothetical protein
MESDGFRNGVKGSRGGLPGLDNCVAPCEENGGRILERGLLLRGSDGEE